LTSRRLFTKNSPWMVNQSILQYYCDVSRRLRGNLRILLTNFGDKRTECWIKTTRRLTFPFPWGIFFTKKQRDCRPPLHPTSSFPRLKMKLKGRHHDTLQMTEAESQTMLNTLTEHGFQDAFRNGRSAWNSAYAQKGPTVRLLVAERSKVSFWSDGRISPEHYGWFLFLFSSLVYLYDLFSLSL
jgi:hypothetical protein